MSGASAPSACLFDLDGTLIDSIELIFRSYEHALAVHAHPPVGRDTLLESLGRPLRDVFGSWGADAARVESLIQAYRAFNLAHHDALVSPYPGSREAVLELRARGLRLGIVTSKKRDMARRGLARCGFPDEFETLVGLEDSARHKPDPEPLRVALERLGLAPGEACYVGDSPHDVDAANAAGIAAIVAGWGPFSPAHFRGRAVAAWLHGPGELPDLLGGTRALQRERE